MASQVPADGDQQLVAEFIPPLSVLLLAAETRKGSRLTSAEAIAVRDSAVVMMNPLAVRKQLAKSRGFVDVDPESLWADWHRLRPQLTNGFLPKIILCVLGPVGFAEQCKAALVDASHAYETLEVQPRDARMVRSFQASVCRADPSLNEKDFAAIEAHQTVVYLVGRNFAPSAAVSEAVTMLELGAKLLKVGGTAMKCESSGIAHSTERWLELANTAKANLDADSEDSSYAVANALIRAFVQLPLSRVTTFYSCGAHLLGVPDAIVSTAVCPDPAEAVSLFRLFHLYLLADCNGNGVPEKCHQRRFRDQNVFRLGPDTPRYRMQWEPCTGYDEDDFFYNSFGRWRFTLADATN